MADAAPRSSVPPNLHAGLRIAGKYELLRKLGSGTMGEVWAARHVSLDGEVAIKLVLRDIAHDDGSSVDSRFLLEARVASQLSRKTRHIVSVTDHGEDGPYAYLVMELLKGESLEARLARTGPLPLAKVVPLVYQIARAIVVAHADGVVHRDLKPSNIFVTVDEDGRVLIKILDFGIAKLRTSLRRIQLSTNNANHSTLRGFLLGTPAYMSPEQACGKTIDPRTDVWALAVIAYHLLTGEFPFDGASAEELFERLCNVEPVPIARWRPDLPGAVGDVFARAFAERIDQRFQSAVSFAGALEHVEALSASSSRPHPLGPISRPPPQPAPSDGESGIVAAGIPARPIWPRLVGAAAVLAALFLTASMLSVYFEREGAVPVAAAPSHPRPTMPAPYQEIPPPPEPVPVVATATLLRPSDLPPAQTPVVPHAPLVTSAMPPPQAEEVAPPVLPVVAAPSPSPPPSKRIDRSEVF